jgi:hypothetical protein
MDPRIATVVAATLGAAASIAVAIITTRSRMRAPESSTIVEAKNSFSVFRALGWGLVSILYLIGAFYLFISILTLFFDPMNPKPIASAQGAFDAILALPFIGIGYWAQQRLRRRGT